MATTIAADLAAGSRAMIGACRFTYEPLQVFKNTVDVHRMAKGEKSYYVPK